MSPKDLARTFDIRNFTTAQNSGHKNISFPIIPAVEFTQQHRYPSQHNGEKRLSGYLPVWQMARVCVRLCVSSEQVVKCPAMTIWVQFPIKVLDLTPVLG